MNEEQIRELNIAVRRAMVAQEEAKRSLKNLDLKNAELFAHGEIPYEEYSRIITTISAPSHQIFDQNNLPSQLNDIVRFAHMRIFAPLFVINKTIGNEERIDLLLVLKDLGFSLNTLFEKPLPSVDIPRIRIGEQPLSKVIDNLLYTFTPFKLRGARKEDYTILLLPSIRGDSITRSWFSHEADYFYESGVKVITPDEIHPTRLNEIQNLIYINGEQYFKLEIDQRIADGVYYCRMGQYISPLQRCNRHDCWLWSVCEGNRFWSRTPMSFYSIAKVSPNIKVRVDKYEKPTSVVDFENILTFEKIDELLAKIYIDSVTFLSRYMIRNPLIKLKETIGYRVNTRSIAIAIDGLWFTNFVKELLLRDAALYTWVYTKYFILNNFDVNDVKQVSRFFWNLIISKKDNNVKNFAKGLESRNITEDLVMFACKILLHTLAHVMHEEIIAVLQTASDNIVYAYSQRPENDGKFRIFLFENAERGLGLTESFASRLQEGKEKVVIDIMNRLSERARACHMEITPTISSEEANENVKKILERLNSYHRILSTTYGISIPVEIARYILAREDDTTRRLIEREDVSAFIDDILSTLPLCWDGCYQCVRLETDCHEPPYEQMFLVSKHLLIALLNEWCGTFGKLPPTSPGSATILKEPIIEIGKARNLFNYIVNAIKNVELISPWMSEQVAKTICDLAIKKKLEFRILTSLDMSVETHKNALKIFLSTKVPNIRIRILPDKQLHAKMILIDKSLCIIGSVNLTLSGLYENIESYVVLSHPDIMPESLSKFEELWNIGIPLENLKTKIMGTKQ